MLFLRVEDERPPTPEPEPAPETQSIARNMMSMLGGARHGGGSSRMQATSSRVIEDGDVAEEKRAASFDEPRPSSEFERPSSQMGEQTDGEDDDGGSGGDDPYAAAAAGPGPWTRRARASGRASSRKNTDTPAWVKELGVALLRGESLENVIEVRRRTLISLPLSGGRASVDRV